MNKLLSYLLLIAVFALAQQAEALVLEPLNRGVVSVMVNDGVFVSWRLLKTDDKNVQFELYRDGEKIYATSSAEKGTNYTDLQGNIHSKYVVKSLLDGKVIDSSSEIGPWSSATMKLQLNRPMGGVTDPYTVTNNGVKESYPQGQSYGYMPNDCSVGDVDGDGEYELFVKWDPTNSRDNSLKGITGNVYIDCYKLDGTLLWRIDLGRNIRAGAHYTQFMVYDLDGDGKAELACKTAPGTLDGKGEPVLMGNDMVTDDYRSTGSNAGLILTGSEYLSVFDGMTGAEISTITYSPTRSQAGITGDSYGNRQDRFLACVAYLDGVKPSLVMCRGYYTQAYLVAFDFNGQTLTQRWFHASTTPGAGAYGQGNHNLSVGDVDGDGKDEIVYGACAIDHDGKLMYRTGIGHGDAIHLSDLDPDLDGLEVFSPHEESSAAYGYEMHRAHTGQVLSGVKTGKDIGRGVAADIDPNYRGFEYWAESTVFDCKGNAIASSAPSKNFRIYWDGDLYDELLDGKNGSTTTTISKWNPSTKKAVNLQIINGATCNTTKATPCLQADILGDWREEVIIWNADSASLSVHTTTIPSEHPVITLMHDHVYRMGIVWQNVAYNQPPHLGYYLPDMYLNLPSFSQLSTSGLDQVLQLGEAILPVVYSWKNALSVDVEGLPEGVTMEIDPDKKVFTLGGTPLSVGEYSIVVKSVGGELEVALAGTIKVSNPVVAKEIAYFSFDEISGSLTAQNQFSGEAVASNYTPDWVDGVSGRAIDFSKGTLPAACMQQEHYADLVWGDRSFSIEFWFKSADMTGVDWYLFHKGSHAKNASTGASGNWVGVQYKNGNLTFGIDDDVVKTNIDVTASAYFNNQWTHLVAVRDRVEKKINLFLNGELSGSKADGTGSIVEREMMVIGNCNVNFNTPFKGAIDELKIYDAALSPSKVYENYQADRPSLIFSVDQSEVPFTIFPADESGQVEIRFRDISEGVVVIKLFSLLGVELWSQEIYAMPHSMACLSDLSGSSTGIYMISVEIIGKQFVQKFSK